MWELVGKLAVVLFVARIGWSLLKGIYGSFLGAALRLNLNLKKTGEWAVITGATDGIGKAYAFEFARLGFKVALVSRNPFKLQNVAAEINSKYGTETKIVDVDFTKEDIYNRLESELGKMDVGVLVNNVGMSYEYPEYFTEISECQKMCDQLINCNIKSLTHMTRIILPGMAERKRGLIMNLSSVSSTIPAPLLAVYGASKAYVQSFSESLGTEYGSKGITVQCVMPGFVVSNMSKIRRPTLMAPSPTAYVKSTLRTVGIEKCTAGYFMHKIQLYFIEVAKMHFPGWILTYIVFRQLKAFNIRALKKRQKQAKAE
ncbi:very-long-chain 3-oxoacyl-CoA reductase [Procambarus clarkii]|uniref:very-long-chain 3-oxoacyl-CoA reductase n=1 Tax=Procambarus clarkii TaxID=6728 RepID=UPI003742B7B4